MNNKTATTIIGIDPGSRVTGYGIIRHIRGKSFYIASGCIRLTEVDKERRLWHLFDGLHSLLEQYQPDVAVVEQVFVHKNVNSALKLGQARGAILCALQGKQIDVKEFTPRLVKKTVVGYGNAEKSQVQHMIMALLSLSGLPAVDAADALALALCYAAHSTMLRGIQ